MLLFAIITQVITIPQASLNLSPILILRFAFLILIYSIFLSDIFILGGLFQTSILLLTYILILLSVFRYNYNLTSYISKNNNLLPILAYIVAILTIFIVFSLIFNLFNSYIQNFDVLFSAFIPVMIYSNAETDKSIILTDTKGKTGIYLWTHKESGKRYIGSAFDLSSRLGNYFNKTYLKKFKTVYIYNALLHHGYSAFSLSILELIDISNLSKEEARKIILEREQVYLDLIFKEAEPNTFNILKVAGSLLGYQHTEESLAKMSEAQKSIDRKGENNPMFGKTGESNPFYGRTHSAETLAKMNKKVFIYTFDSVSKEKKLFKSFNNITEAAEHYKCSKRTLFYYIDKNKLYKKQWMLSSS
jgi:group I intron endonuclease